MSAYIELKYIQLISPSLERFRWAVPSKIAACRCYICGDSKKSKFKTRACFYLVQQSNKFNYKCYNCSASMSLKKFLKLHFPHYYQEYRLEMYADIKASRSHLAQPSIQTVEPINKKVDVNLDSPSSDLVPLTKLPSDHIAIKYCESRMIPKSAYTRLYYTKNYKEWVEGFIDTEGKKFPTDDRIVMLMKDRHGKIFGAQGRALNSSAIRYSTIKFDESVPKVFGLDSITDEYPIFVLEGAIDSLFIPNSLAICGGDVGTSLSDLGIPYERFVFVLDNEPRSADTIRRMLHAVELGASICIWTIDSSLKDVNDMIKSGISRKELLETISHNIYKGTKAIMKIKQWKKV